MNKIDVIIRLMYQENPAWLRHLTTFITEKMYKKSPKSSKLKKLGTISVGGAPDMPITIETRKVLGDNVKIYEVGFWDGFSKDELEKFKPEKGEDILLGQLSDGTDYIYAEKYVPERLQACVDKLEAQGCDIIMMYCAGGFQFQVKTSVPLIRPGEIARAIVKEMVGCSRILVLIPPGFEEQWKVLWSDTADEVFTLAVWSDEYNYEAFFSAMDNALNQIAEINPDLIIMDCMGYDDIMKNYLININGKRVVHTRGLALNVVKQMLGQS